MNLRVNPLFWIISPIFSSYFSIFKSVDESCFKVTSLTDLEGI